MRNNSEKPKRPRWKNLLLNLAFSALVFFLCAVVFEIILRLNHYGNLEIYEPDPHVYWQLKPNQDCFTKVDRQPVHINSQGTRGPEFTLGKPANTIRIVSLGDSRTFGWGLADGETYSRRLEQLLQKQFGGEKKVEVINAGVNAWSYPQLLAYFRETGLKFHPDYVIVGDANLWTQFSEKNSPEFVRQLMWRVRLKNFLRRFAIYHYIVEVKLREFYQANRTKFIPADPKQDELFKAQQQSDPDAVFRGAITELCRLAQTNGVRSVLFFAPILSELEDTNACAVLKVKRKVADEFSAPLVDVSADLRPQGKALYLDADPVHLTATGNEMVALRLFECFTNQIHP